MKKLILLASVLTFFSPPSQAATYRTCAQDFYPKFHIHDHKMAGYAVEIINALERVDKNIHFEGYEKFCTMPRIEADLLSGRLDVFVAAFKTPKREKSFDFLEAPLNVLKYVMVIRKNDPIKVSSFDDIRKMEKDNVVLTLFGTALESYLREQPHLKIESSASTPEANLRMLESGRGRFFFIVDIAAVSLLKKPQWKNKFAILPGSFGENRQYIMVSKKASRKDVAVLLSAAHRLQANGELERISQVYKNGRNE